jgi:hypothetical protein
MAREDESYPLALPITQTSYPILQLVAKRGGVLAGLTTSIIVAAGLFAWVAGLGWGWALGGAVLASFAYVMMRCFAELVHLIVDTMIPK